MARDGDDRLASLSLFAALRSDFDEYPATLGGWFIRRRA